jgi:myo-inositol-1(or 4)-monophosphatase
VTAAHASAPDPAITRLALDLAARVRAAVVPALGAATSRTDVGLAPGGDVTMAIDEIAETVTEQCCAAAGDIAFYSEDRGYVEIGRPRAILLIDPIDGTRPAAAGFEACCVSVAVLPSSRDATLGDVQFGVVHEIKHDQRFYATRGEGARMERNGAPVPIVLSDNVELRALFWASGLRGRPARQSIVVLEELIDGCSMHGSFFDLGSATFDMTRIVSGQLDAYVDMGWLMLHELPELEAAFRRAGDGRVCTNFPYDVAAAALVVQEAGGVVTAADGGPLSTSPAIGSGDGWGVAVIASASRPLHDRLLEATRHGMQRLRAQVVGGEIPGAGSW